MRQFLTSRFVFRLLFVVPFAFATGCTHESFRGEAGSGFKLGIAVTPTAAFLAVLTAALLGYFAWGRSRKR